MSDLAMTRQDVAAGKAGTACIARVAGREAISMIAGVASQGRLGLVGALTDSAFEHDGASDLV